ncbi:MAG TPA: DegQ family serine endoprotease, partial [Burkholderiales bacterium]|nr:DegQ family serine endoprotease [Burkholderiales bacterium]
MNSKTMVIALIAAGLIGAGAVGYSERTSSVLANAGAPMTQQTVGALGPMQDSVAIAPALPDFTSIAAKYGPAVVNVSVTAETRPAAAMPQLPQMDPDDPFYQFFKRFQVPVPRGEMPMHGMGSGFIVSSDGIILTNAHVVDGAKQVDVKLTDKREFRARVMGVDKQSDVAVLKIEAKDLPTVKLGNPANLRVGDWVLAIGSPFGFENTVTQGIVSAKWRSLPDETYVPFIQTDVPVNPGNSGGPLINMQGEVVGINSQIYSHSGGYEGLSFAIPIDIAANVEQQIVEHGHVTRGRLGITIQDMTQGLADSFGLKSLEGALVSTVEAGSPAAKAGVEPGDVILKFNGQRVDNSAQLPVQVAQIKPGTTVSLELLRKGATKELNVTVGELRNTAVAQAETGAKGHGRLGLMVRPLTPEEREQAGDSAGLLVENATGPAAQAGIQPGDVIVAMNGTPLTSAKQLSELVAKAGKHV